MQIAGKRVLVTGGASGLGAATVAEFRAAGAAVRVLDRSLGQDVMRDQDVAAGLVQRYG